MTAYKDKERRTWYATFRYRDWTGIIRQKKKRGFKTKREALEWEFRFKQKNNPGIDIKLADFIEIYQAATKPRLKYNTWKTKDYVFKTKVIPYLGEYRLEEITVREIIKWQNELIGARANGETYSATYLRTIHQDLSAVFNYATRYYNLSDNPVRKAGTMGGDCDNEMRFWTREEYLRFAEMIEGKGPIFYSFELLYWCGIRVGELLALTAEDFDFSQRTIRISKSYQRIEGCDYITEPKTKKSNRTVIMPNFLAEELEEYVRGEGGEESRLFKLNKMKLARAMKSGAAKAGVVPIRIHDLRHSHISLLIDMGFTPLAIADRVGHESERITYRYAHLFPNRQREIAEKLDKARRE